MAFFSGQDINTLQAEGNDTNCFVSLIVDTKGTYQAAITRKVKTKKEVTTKFIENSYTFFGEGSITENPPQTDSTNIVEKEEIEYFMLTVERETSSLDYLDKRFEEIEADKQKLASVASTPATSITTTSTNPNSIGWIDLSDNDYSFKQWKEMEELKKTTQSSEETIDNGNISCETEIDLDTIHLLVCQMLTCSFTINKDMGLSKWVSVYMENKYNEIFGDPNSTLFIEWKSFIVDFQITRYEESKNIHTAKEVVDNYDTLISNIASAMYDELCKYTTNTYIELYKEEISAYL